MKLFSLFLFVLIISGCGSSESEPKVSYKTEYIMFNARHVSEPMQMEIVYNNNSDFNDTISYAKEDSHSLWWYKEDNITLKYSQDKALHVSFPENPKIKGKKLICAIGNADMTSAPMIISPLDDNEIRKGMVYLQVLNAMNDNSEKRIYINYEDDRSEFTPFNTSSEKFYIEPSTNSFVVVQSRNGSTFQFDDSITFDADHAYFIIIYESVESADIPKIAIIDMTP